MDAPSTPAGWYRDGELVGTERYWDGSAWTDDRRPASGPGSPPPPSASPGLAPSTGAPSGLSAGQIVAIVFGVLALIVIFVIAAVAIPTFNAQRDRQQQAAAQSDLRNAAIAQETHFTNFSTYTSSLSDLEREGFRPSQGVTVIAVLGDDRNYCVGVIAPNGEQWKFDTRVDFQPMPGTC